MQIMRPLKGKKNAAKNSLFSYYLCTTKTKELDSNLYII